MDIQDIDKKITIVMPVHNTPSVYLNEALDSLKSQSFQRFRLICVDDKSTDNDTIRTLQDWSEKYENMEIVYLPEAVGAAEARNVGLRMAEEEYIIFLDSDDIFEKDFLEKMYKRIKESNAQVCMCAWKTFSENKIGMCNLNPDIKKDDENFLNYEWFIPWNKLCKRDFLINKDIYFQNIASYNDIYYSICVLFEAENICYIQEYLIRYRILTSHQISANRNPMNMGYACKFAMERYAGEENLKKRIQIFLTVLRLMKNQCKDNSTYDLLSDYVKNNIVKEIKIDNIKNETARKTALLIEKGIYNWKVENNSFLFQLYSNKDELIKQLEEYEKIYLWGLGKRGQAFQEFCKDNALPIVAVADSKNENVGEKNLFGNKIINTEDLLLANGVIVACNNIVYEILCHDENIKNKIINLQKYCPL